tara:strand:- start:13580 stop:16747 length:3168 start_codon:yes stop_codon:yes gene_type:complete
MGRLQYNTILGGSHTNDNWMNDSDIISKMYNDDTQKSVDSNSLFTVHHIQSNGKLDIHENISLTTPLQEYLDLSNDSNLVYLYQPSHLYSSLKLEQNLEEQGINTELLNECCPNESIIIGETPIISKTGGTKNLTNTYKKLYERIDPEYGVSESLTNLFNENADEEKRADEERDSMVKADLETKQTDLETKLASLDEYFENKKSAAEKYRRIRPPTSDDRIEARKELERFYKDFKNMNIDTQEASDVQKYNVYVNDDYRQGERIALTLPTGEEVIVKVPPKEKWKQLAVPNKGRNYKFIYSHIPTIESEDKPTFIDVLNWRKNERPKIEKRRDNMSELNIGLSSDDFPERYGHYDGHDEGAWRDAKLAKEKAKEKLKEEIKKEDEEYFKNVTKLDDWKPRFPVGSRIQFKYLTKWYDGTVKKIGAPIPQVADMQANYVIDIRTHQLEEYGMPMWSELPGRLESDLRWPLNKSDDDSDENDDSDDDDDSDNDDDDANQVKAIAETIFNLTRKARGVTNRDVDEPKVRKSKRIEYIKSGLKQKEDEERRKHKEDVKKLFREVGDSYMKSLMDENSGPQLGRVRLGESVAAEAPPDAAMRNSDEEEEGVPEMKESEPELRRSDRLKGVKSYIPSYIKSEIDDNEESDSTVEEPISDSEDEVQESKSKAIREERRKIQERVDRRLALSNTAASLRPVVASAFKKDKSSTPVPRRRSRRIAAQEEKKSEAKEDDLGEMFQPRRRSLRIAEQSSTRDEQKDSLENTRRIYESSNVGPRLRRSRRNRRRTTGGADDESPTPSENELTQAATTLSSIGDVDIIKYWSEQAELARRRGELGPYINAQNEVERAVERARPRRHTVGDYEDMFQHVQDNLGSLVISQRNNRPRAASMPSSTSESQVANMTSISLDDGSMQDSENSNMEESKDESKNSYMDESKNSSEEDSFGNIDTSRPDHPHPFAGFNTPPLDDEHTPTSREIEKNREAERKQKMDDDSMKLVTRAPTFEENQLWEDLQRPAMQRRTQERLGSIDMDDFMEDEKEGAPEMKRDGPAHLFSPRRRR